MNTGNITLNEEQRSRYYPSGLPLNTTGKEDVTDRLYIGNAWLNLELSYASNARNTQLYDFKATNGNPDQVGKDMGSHYRGMSTGEEYNGYPLISSARDIGNIAAGYVASHEGMSWRTTRMAFDAYQYYQDKSIEGASSTNAQILGYRLGRNTSNAKSIRDARNIIDSRRFINNILNK